MIQEEITLDDVINSILCSHEMRLFDAVLELSTAVLLAKANCEFGMLIGIVIYFVF